MTPQPFFCPRRGAQGSIPCYEWPPKHVRRSTVLVVHGLGDHGRALPYLYLASALASTGRRVLAFDQRGHGQVKRVEKGRARLPQLMDDLEDVSRHCRTKWAEDTLTFVGMSMGAIVALSACQRTPGLADGVVAVSAPLGPVAASPIAIAAARVLGGVLPGWPLSSGIDLAEVTADQEALKAYTTDPLFHSTIAAGLASDLLAAPQSLRAGAGAFSLPILMLHGDSDRIAPWDPVFPSMVSPQLLSVRMIQNGRHNLFLDSARGTVFAELDSWLEQLEFRRSSPRDS